MARETPNYTLKITQGATLNLPMTWRDSAGAAIDVTSYTAVLRAKEKISDSANVLDMTSANSQIVVGNTNGIFTLALTAAETAALSFRKAIYQMEVTSPAGVVTRLIQGTVLVSTELIV